MENVFLATTALEDFWDTSKPIVFLGEWCKRFSRRSVWEKLECRVVANLWSQRDKVEENQRFLKALYEKILLVLARSLNHLHDMSASNRYWRILLGAWLYDYIYVVHDRTVTLQAARSQFPNFSTILLSEESFVIPSDSDDLGWLISEDAYNLQIYTKILSFWGAKFSRKPLEIKTNPGYLKKESLLEKMKVKNFLKLLFRALSKITSNMTSIALKDSYFSYAALIQLFLKTGGAFWSYFDDYDLSPQFPPDRGKRARLECDLLATSESEFERLLAHLLPSDIPQTFIEGFASVREESKKRYPSKPKLIFSANSWYAKDHFKEWAASQAEKGIALVGTQHGGNYGCLLDHPTEENELAIWDLFYSWGWKNDVPKIKPFVATKLAARKKIKTNPREESILFAMTSMPRYPFPGSSTPTLEFADYFSWQLRFLKSIPVSLRQRTRLRPHYVDYGRDISELWDETFPSFTIENWSIPFLKSLEQCRLYICDHLSTTFIESLAAEKPTILFWDFDVNPLRPEAIPFYDALCSVDILHRSPESAANHLISIYDNVFTWWNSPECLKARREFCYQFGRTSPNAIQEWAEEFKKIVA